jgi:nucleotide-binding universal stress UspA family protein
MTEFQPQKILVPTDFSEIATRALRHAVEIAKRSGGEILVMYADPFEPPLHFTAGQVPGLVEALKQTKEAATRELQEYARRNAPGVKLRGAVVEGTAATSILRASETSGADLIVMGTHGRSGVSRMLMGSVAERVLNETRVPLMTVRDDHPPVVKRILCPINFSEAAAAALKNAAALARLFEARLVVLHVIEGGALADEDLQRRAEDWARQECSIADVETFVLRGNAAEQVIEYARSNGIDLIVLGAEHRRFSDTTVLGTTIVRVTRHSPVPVLTVISG